MIPRDYITAWRAQVPWVQEVQVSPAPAGPMLDALHEILDPWLGKPQWKQTTGGTTLVYRFESEDTPPVRLRLKIEINSREHFSVFGFKRIPFCACHSRRFDLLALPP